MQLIRKVSLVKRVVVGQATLGLFVVALGLCASALLSSQVDAVNQLAKVGSAGAELAAVQAGAERAVWIIGALASAAVVLGAVATWLIVASIRESVESTVQCVVRIAGGDLETKIDSPGKDEISWLRAELNGMRKKLRTMVIDVRQTAASVNTATAEIASGNMDLSTRTEMQAQALQSTAETVHQLAATVRSNAQSTQEARSVVEQSSAVAGRGAQTMRDVVARMGEINNSSSRITEIIGVIDGIAFQTNILALNAAVEAARAGDHGRGFAVVASEVRNLAQRSSVAAREIKGLIGDSSEKVESGCKLVDDAGRTMHEIEDSVTRVATLIAAIARAGESQSSDLDNVNQSVVQIDSMTQQNAAMVEELAATAQSLKAQSERLTASMGSFRVVV